ncbi:MAG: hypothetical protein JKY42_00365 [Flavobacteriales bacterium]|nr:hypothetical protein [Flavobacteriales bacterium]
MSKYRLLTQVELNELEKEFVQYLVVNGITAEDWENIKKNETDRAEEVLSVFSDVVFEGVMRKVKFLDNKSVHSLKSFQCLDDKIVLVGLDVQKGTNLLDVKQFQHILSDTSNGTKIYTSEKKYNKQRELELFDMVTNGCEISEGDLFKNLCLVLPNK